MSNICTKPAIVFDIDNTLVYVTPIAPNNLENTEFFTIKIKRRKFYVQTRPYLNYFLEKISKLYNVYFFTASSQEYASQIINKIYPQVKQFHSFFRDSCTEMYGYLVKDLNKIKTPLQKTLLIDDSTGSALKSPKNLVKIFP